ILRRLLRRPDWRHAILLTQWEVARKRAGVGGGTLLTAQSAPWSEFTLHGRVPARAFRPAPSVDGGILSITRDPPRSPTTSPICSRMPTTTATRTVVPPWSTACYRGPARCRSASPAP